MWRRDLLGAAAAAALSPHATGADADYAARIEAWRREREAALRADDGWLTVTGLYWLESGPNQFEQLPGLQFDLVLGRVMLRGAAGSGRVLKPDVSGPADTVTLGSRTAFVITRGGRFAIRVRDRDSRYRREFRGLRWYPIDARYRVEGRLAAHPRPRKVSVSTVIAGLTEDFESPGVVEFTLNGSACRLEPVLSGGRLFFIFKDPTAGKTTYPAGRFLYADLPRNGAVTLDFNQAHNPPCAFTPHATCPLPPRQNHLAIPVEAGELNYHFD